MSFKRPANRKFLLNDQNRPSKIVKQDKTDDDDVQYVEDPPGPSDHYLITEIKGEENDIDFVLTDKRFVGKSGPPAECIEEIQFDEFLNEEEDANEGENTQEIVEHVCGKCFKSFRLLKIMKRHLAYCIFNSEMVQRRDDMLKNIEKIEKEAVVMEKKDICFCCGDNYDTCHLGHINCTECPKTFKTQIALERHMFLIHSEKNDFPCTTCNGRIRTKKLLDLHLEQHRNRGKPFACKSCGKDFTRQYHLKRHHKYSPCGDGKAETMQCKVCGKEFFRLDNLRVHLKSHLGQGTPKKAEYTCPCCKKCFYSLSTLNIHIRTHTGERPFDCDLCDKNFPSLVSLKKHRRYHTGEKPYTCEVCQQNFAVKEVLNRHMKRHTGEKPHKCTFCDKRFIQATQCKNHMRTHERPFECSLCPEKFKTEKQFEKHYKTHSNRTQKKKPAATCEDCNIKFTTQTLLLKHLTSASHTEKAKQFCPHCGLECPNLKSLEFHLLKEHESVDFKCSKCNIVFEENHLLQTHLKTAHEISSSEPMTKTPVEKAATKIIKPPVVLPVKQEENDCIIIKEFIVDSLDTTSDIAESEQNEFTVIARENEISPEFKKVTKYMNKKSNDIRAELKKSLANCLREEPAKTENEDNMSPEDVEISENVGKLLDMLVDAETLTKFGWPDDSVENVLCKVIKNCGYNLEQTKFTEDYGERMREFVKLLFTVVIQNDSIKELLNNYQIDEVIDFVLSNEDDD